ncbi:S8 family peptidase [Amycolatopsis coloradensis]|uniref:S8 family peptidase n=1 Tax=Amycolatopsis coloradensis TaxID=76021 RepID=A0ACD5BUR9_9PSEU
MQAHLNPLAGGVLRSRPCLFLIVLSLLLTMIVVGGASAEQSVATRADRLASGDEQSHRVTLLTGDVVTYFERAGGQAGVSIEPAPRPGEPPIFLTRTDSDGFSVIPSDVEPYLVSGAIDPDLFDIKELVRQGLTDAKTGKLPVIVSYGNDTPAEVVAHQADAFPASDRTLTLSTINAAAVKVRRAEAGAFWRALVGQGGNPEAFSGDVKIRLDRRVRVNLDESAAQIGAPQAWRAGLDGSGVTVAVLDTGIDAAHPDLAGKIAGSRNFTTDPDTNDGYGHGTHVASIIAGSGTASAGKYRGVASGVKLLNAKVLDSAGYGEESQLMAGMEWAARSGARVINLSLGAGPSAGGDPLSEMADKLTAATGALFVAAAGNSGGIAMVETPAAASTALAVGAVDKADKTARFSSKGPRLTDAMVKPEIVAPGVGIAAARASGTNIGEPVGERYTRLSGTSMATPHVAGAAAILAQKHPQWRSSELKAMLTSTGKDVGVAWYEQGAGRVDIPKTLASTVLAPSAISFGRLPGSAGSAKVKRPVTYTNLSDRAVTVSLEASVTTWKGEPAPAGMVTLDSDTLVVPSGGKATATVTIDPAVGGGSGAYGGVVRAKAADGKADVKTPISFYKEPEKVSLTVKLIDSQGKAPGAQSLTVVRDDYDWSNWKNNDPFLPPVYSVTVQGGTGTISVPHGHYSVTATIAERRGQTRRASLLVAAGFPVHKPSTVALDARATVPMQIQTQELTDTRERFTSVHRTIPGAPVAFASGVLTSGAGWKMFVTPATPAGRGTVGSQDYLTLGQALVSLRVRTRAGEQILHPEYDPAAVAGENAGERQVAVPASMAASGFEPTKVLDMLTGGKVRLSLDRPESDRLEQLIRGGDALLLLSSRKQPEYMYNVYFRDRNGVPAQHVNKVDRRRMLAIDTRYHGDRADLVYRKRWFALPTDGPSSIALSGTQFQGQGKWTEYVGPADDTVFWKRYVTQMAPGKNGVPDFSTTFTMIAENIFANAGRAPEERWFQSPIRGGAADHNPGAFPVLCSLCRGDNGEFLPAAQWMDSTSGHYSEPWQSGEYLSKVTLRQGGEEIPAMRRPDLPIPLFQLDRRTGTFRLDSEDTVPDRPVFGWPNKAVHRLTPRISTTSTFRSAPPEAIPPGYGCLDDWRKCSYQPLITIGYQLGLDLLNQAPAGKLHVFDVTAGHHHGAEGAGRINEFRLWYSTNDGAKWDRAEVVRSADGRYSVRVAHPRLGETSGFVSLRAEAWDTAGNRMSQTLERAYALTEHPAP